MNVILLNFIQQLLRRVATPGDIKMRASENVPTGWVECNGASYSMTLYPALFNEIGYSWGGSAGNFNVPDFRGVVPRGWNNSAGDAFNDPNSGTRVARYAGGLTGDNVGSYQQDELEGHTHTTSFGGPAGAAFTVGAFDSPASTAVANVTNSTGGSETRPKNAYVMFLIKI